MNLTTAAPMTAPAGQPSVTLYHGDCLDVMPTLSPGSVSMVFADLPYKSKRFYSTECHWDTALPLSDLWPALKKVGIENAAYIFTAAQPFTTDLIISNREDFRYCLVWDKMAPGNFVQANKMPMRHHEDVAIFYKKQPTYNPQMVQRDKPRVWKAQQVKKSHSAGVRNHNIGFEKIYTHKHPRSIIIASKNACKDRGMHPTQKPVALLEWLISTYTHQGDTILDPVAGSGTTAIAALRTGRNVVCIEKDPAYFEVMRKRIADEQARLGFEVTV